ncbi:GNAT family N-acetyltransferase [Salinisphaera sp. SPP-AMP-43]|uniref:GNAT family N-acetyltransferase n=1 Tax=Salinisphaera sp. SPP-AMP-43 TaxID=3121288 RepID=UPI003C6E9C95
MNPSCDEYARRVPGIGRLALRPFDIGRHAGVAHRWLTSEHARFWGMQDQSAAETVDYFAAIQRATTHQALIGLHNDQPAFLLESYEPAAEPIGAHYPVASGDRGFHILIAPPTQPIHLFTWAVFALVVDWLFSDPAVARLVVEPDVANQAIHTLNRRAGFCYRERIALADKTAWLATCTELDHDRAMIQLTSAQARVCGRIGVPA